MILITRHIQTKVAEEDNFFQGEAIRCEFLGTQSVLGMWDGSCRRFFTV